MKHAGHNIIKSPASNVSTTIIFNWAHKNFIIIILQNVYII